MMRILRAGVFCLLLVFCLFPFPALRLYLSSRFQLPLSSAGPTFLSADFRHIATCGLPTRLPKLSSSSAASPSSHPPPPGQQPPRTAAPSPEPERLPTSSCPVPSAAFTFAQFPKSFPDSGPAHLTLQILGPAKRWNQVSQLLVIDLRICECTYEDI